MSDTKHTNKNPLLKLATLPIVAVVGVVYADIGTSPLYAINELVNHGAVKDSEAIKGAISLVFWAITLISFKYLMLVLRADHQREGGVFALLNQLKKDTSKYSMFLVTALVLGAGLLIAEGTLTPAISVLSAVEGTALVTSALSDYVVPITLVIILGLFLVQKKGTHKIGAAFGPIMVLWFATIAFLGARQIVAHPQIIQAINPLNIVHFVLHVGLKEDLIVLGFVVLVITGGEALYADLGHFGRRPIQIGWFALVYPALAMSYLGQGAFLLSGQTVIGNNLFFSLVPKDFLIPMVLLATVSTIIASQALITGAYSLAIQAMELHLMPRVRTLNTNELHKGQVYVPFVNWALMIGCMALVILFQSSTKLASAYGLSVSSVMLLTSLSMIKVSQLSWGWPKSLSILIFGFFALVDSIFLVANSLKFTQGGYIPMMIGFVIFGAMTTWRWGRRQIFESHKSRGYQNSYKQFFESMSTSVQASGASFVCLINTSKLSDKSIPLPLQEYRVNHGSYPRQVVLLHFKPALSRAKVSHDEAISIKRIVDQKIMTHGAVDLVQVTYGFMQTPNLSWVLSKLHHEGLVQLKGTVDSWAIAVVRENLKAVKGARLSVKVRAKIFDALRRNATSSYKFFTDDHHQNRLWNIIEDIPVR